MRAPTLPSNEGRCTQRDNIVRATNTGMSSIWDPEPVKGQIGSPVSLVSVATKKGIKPEKFRKS